MIKKLVSVFIIISVLIGLTYFLGPKPTRPELSPDGYAIMNPSFNPNYLQDVVSANEAKLDIRKGNESQLYWADSATKKTKYVLLYLHGFSASPAEGDAVHLAFAKRYGMNMYAPLLAEHGLVEDEPMINFTANAYLESTKNALRLARLMGDSVIIMGTSTGCTAALYLASGQNEIHSLINYSPNIKIFDPKAFLLSGPWGLDIARVVKGGNYHTWEAPLGAEQYWHTKYRLESLIELQLLVEATMTAETFNKVSIPVFTGYYYKNEDEQDDVVSVTAILDMHTSLSSTEKQIVVFPEAGAHAMGSSLYSDKTQIVSDSTYVFAEKTLGLVPLN